MPYEHDAPVAYEEPVERTPTAVTRWWRDLPRTGLGFGFTVAVAAIAWFTGIARDGRGPFVGRSAWCSACCSARARRGCSAADGP